MQENRKKWLVIAIAAGLCLLLLLAGAAAVSWHMVSEKLAQTSIRKPEQETDAQPQGAKDGGKEKNHKPLRCETQGLSFLTYEDWVEIEEADYAYMVRGEEGTYNIWLNGVSMLGSGTAQETYEELALYYRDEEEYQFTEYDHEMEEIALSDGVLCQCGFIYGNDGQGIYDTMVAAVPQKNYLITFGGYTEDGAEEELLDILSDLCASLQFAIGSRDEISGNTFITETGGELCLNQDGTFLFQGTQDGEGSGDYSGTYAVYYGDPAVEKAVTSFDLPLEIVEKVISYNMGGYALGGVFPDNVPEGRMRYRVCRDTFYVVMLYIESRAGEPVEEEAGYFGFYIPELQSTDFVDETTYQYAVWELAGRP